MSIPGRKSGESKDVEAHHSILGTVTSLEGLDGGMGGERGKGTIGSDTIGSEGQIPKDLLCCVTEFAGVLGSQGRVLR